MKNTSIIFKHRFGLVATTTYTVVILSFLTRLILLIKSWNVVDLNLFHVIGIFGIGLFYDLVVSSFFAIPVALYCLLMKDSWYRKQWSLVSTFLLLLIINLILVMNAGAEIAFWDEFGARFNFIAVDYLVYTTEVLGNIKESYNIPLILFSVFAVSGALLILFRKKILQSQEVSMRFAKRGVFFLYFLTIPLSAYFFVNNKFKNFSNNNYINELSGAGIYEFGSAFWHNEIDYQAYYTVNNNNQNISLLKNMLSDSSAVFNGDELSIDRKISSNFPEKKWNVVLISMESFSADFMSYFGHQSPPITPYLDSLTSQSLFFDNFYATGTRTVRGLEALSLCIPPTPGQSIVRRPNNEDMFTIGSVLGSKGYDVKYIYGGNSFFDNMGYFFSNSGYKVIDRKDIPDDNIHHENAWGVSDEDAFHIVLQECDKSYKIGKPFFNHIMTVSNHRPFTYPDGRIDIPSAAHVRDGAVKYTDYAIREFIETASKKPWFSNTLFVIVSDHCASSAGKTDLPVTRYHIPCFIYSPALIKPKIEKRLVSQIDLGPTILGLMNMQYESRFLGYDINTCKPENDRVFISTYQDLGYLKKDTLVILSPKKKIRMYKTNLNSGEATAIPLSQQLVKEAIAWYQGASYLFKSGKYKKSNK